MGSFSLGHWAIVLLIVVVVFGTKRLGTLGGDVGGAIKGFKAAIKGNDDPITTDERR